MLSLTQFTYTVIYTAHTGVAVCTRFTHILEMQFEGGWKMVEKRELGWEPTQAATTSTPLQHSPCGLGCRHLRPSAVTARRPRDDVPGQRTSALSIPVQHVERMCAVGVSEAGGVMKVGGAGHAVSTVCGRIHHEHSVSVWRVGRE